MMMVSNHYEEERKKSGNHYMTTKKEKHRHGFGLNIIRKIARRYDGEVIIDDGNHQFVVTVLLYEIFSMYRHVKGNKRCVSERQASLFFA